MPFRGPELAAPAHIPSLLLRGVDRTPDDIAIVSTEMSWSWQELNEVTRNVAENLVLRGLKPGDRIASLMPNRTHLLILYLACFRAGLVIVPLNYRYTPTEIDHALEVSGASMLIFHAERAGDITASTKVRGLRLGWLPYRPEDPQAPHFEQLYKKPPERNEIEPFSLDGPAAIFFTSGSTGKPKGVTHSFNSLGYIFASAAGACKLTSDDVMLPGSSMSHLGGFLFSFAALMTGARVVVARAYDSEELLPLLQKERPTVLCMLPSALLPLIRDHGATKADFASIRLCRSGSDKVPMELEAEFEELTGLKIDEGYGISEAGLPALNPPEGVIKIGSIGTANPGFEVSIRDGEGREVPMGTAGNLWIKSPSLMIGYWENPEETAKAVQDGWLDSGDIMKVDEDHYLWFQGRKKQIIVHDGSNIFPQEVEDAILAHPAVAGAGVIGIHDLIHGENVRAYVTVREGHARPTAYQLIEFTKQRIGYKAPEEIVFLDEIPLNPTGKTDRMRLKEIASAHHG
ncbi:MAG: hypothetical protein COB93_00840 [Sneathiella sp.]|nr:MAG: hypothetical protein COB93_00840 [Sneathiella sp.]